MSILHREVMIACPPVSTLLWDSNELLDVTNGIRVSMDGSVQPLNRIAAYPFDRAVGIRHNQIFWSVAFANRGTKGILLKDGVVQRELNRSFYFANLYDYPMSIALAQNGRPMLIHCPHSFDTIEIEDAETGTSLATIKSEQMEFHSRFAVSCNGRYLLDAGWFWHPLGGAWVCDLSSLAESPQQAPSGVGFSFGAEIDSAAFLDNDKVVVTSTEEVVNEETPLSGLGPNRIGVWSLENHQWQSMAQLSEPSGTLMPWREWVIAFHGHPKAIELSTGIIVHRWDNLFSGKQVGSIDLGEPVPPALALDPQNGRFAVSGPSGITVINLAEH